MRWLEEINKSKIHPKNKKLINDFVSFLKARDTKAPASRTLYKHIYCYKKILDAFDSNKTYLFDMKKEDVEKLVGKINALTSVNEDTKAKIKITLRMMAKHFKGDGYFMPKEYAWIKASSKMKRVLTQNDLLTRQEIEKLKNATKNMRDYAIICLMDDVPLRTHELLLLKRKNIILESGSEAVIIPANTKTGTRTIPLRASVMPLKRYLESVRELRPEILSSCMKPGMMKEGL